MGGVRGGGKGVLNFQSERLDRGTDSSDADEWRTSESQMLCEGLRNRIRRVIQTLITQWVSGESESGTERGRKRGMRERKR